MSFAAPKFTTAGAALHARAIAGETLTFTTIQMGDGELGSSALASLTALIDPLVSIDISSITRTDNYVTLKAVFSNAELATGFYWREVGVFAADPDDPDNRAADILYCYQNAGGLAEYIPTAASESVEKVLAISAVVSDAEDVTIEFSTQVYVLQEDFEDHVNNETIHVTQAEKDEWDAKGTIDVTGILKGVSTSGTISVAAATAGTDYQAATQKLTESADMDLEDLMPYYDVSGTAHRSISVEDLKALLGVQSPTIVVTTCDGATVTCTNGTTTLTGTGSCTFSLSNIGTYTVTAELDGASVSAEVEVTGVNQYTVDLRIAASVAITTEPDTMSYNYGADFDPTGMVVTITYADGTTSETDDYTWDPETLTTVGTETVTVTVTVGTSTFTDTLDVTVSNISVSTPVQSGSLTYTGSAQTPTWEGYDSSVMTIGGTTSATNAGTYTATFTLADSYQWADGTTAAKSVSWTIAKATGSLSISPTSLTLSISAITGTITVARDGDGTISAVASDSSVATVSVSGTTVTVTGVATGNATITISVAETTNYTAPSSQTCAITVEMPNTTLSSNDWSVISAASSAGVASNYWSVGDRIGVALSGTVGALTFSGTYYAYILGFDHNSSYEGSNRIHFQFGFTALSSGVHVAFVDDNYGSSGNSAGFRMNTSSTNSGGWSSSYMRSTICSAFKSAMPTALQNVLKTVTKYSDNTGGGANTSSYVTATTDIIFLLAEYEIFGSRANANSYEYQHQAQYSYYSSGNSKIMYKHSDTSTACYLWERSPCYGTSGGFCIVGADGIANYYNNAYYSRGFAPCFCV